MPQPASLFDSTTPRELLTAADVARVCAVDLKTIHNWAERGRIRHFRTPGRHLRVRRIDLLDFLRRYGYPVPPDLQLDLPRLGLLWPAAPETEMIATALSQQFTLVHHTDVFTACAAIGAAPPDVLVLPAAIDGVGAATIFSSLRACTATRHVRAVIYAANAQTLPLALHKESACVWVQAPNLPKLLTTLASLLGQSSGSI